GKQQKEVERERRERDACEVFDELQNFVARVRVAGGGVNVDDERQQRYEVEQQRLARRAAEEREETDREIEKPDEAEDEIRVIDLQLGRVIRERQCFFA